MDKAKIDFAEINKYGAVVVYGSEGTKHYYGYTMAEAKRKYREDTRIFKNHRRRKMSEITIEEVIKRLKAEYERAKKKSFVAKPMAYALISIWREVDLMEMRRKLPHVGGSDDEN